MILTQVNYGLIIKVISMAKQINLPLISKKKYFLNNIRGNGKNKYSRYSQSPIRYAGGKSLAVGHILEHIPDNLTKICSPFIGGGSVEIACANELDMDVFAYDIFAVLTIYWNVQLCAQDSLADKLEKFSPNKNDYLDVKIKLTNHWNGNEPIHDWLTLASYYWFNHNLSYGPCFLGWMSSVFECEAKYKRMVYKVRNFDAPRLFVTLGDFEDVMSYRTHDFMFCDPPYHLEDGTVFKGMYPSRNHPVHHVGFNHELLRDILHNHKAGFVLCYNDCETIREWYKDFDIHEVSWQYTMGQGETRIGKNRKEAGADHVKKSNELIIVKTN